MGLNESLINIVEQEDFYFVRLYIEKGADPLFNNNQPLKIALSKGNI